MKYLVEGANIHADNDFALRESARCGRLEILKYLVDKGVDICTLTINKIKTLGIVSMSSDEDEHDILEIPTISDQNWDL